MLFLKMTKQYPREGNDTNVREEIDSISLYLPRGAF